MLPLPAHGEKKGGLGRGKGPTLTDKAVWLSLSTIDCGGCGFHSRPFLSSLLPITIDLSSVSVLVWVWLCVVGPEVEGSSGGDGEQGGGGAGVEGQGDDGVRQVAQAHAHTTIHVPHPHLFESRLKRLKV